jgi:hypothetical protein
MLKQKISSIELIKKKIKEIENMILVMKGDKKNVSSIGCVCRTRHQDRAFRRNWHCWRST